MRRELKKKELDKCLKIYKENADGTISYRIGNRIILKKRIGSDSVYGIVYLSEFREKEKKLFTFASKIYEYEKSKTVMELDILMKLTNIVRMDLCPHFPIFYGYSLCDNFLKDDKDSFIKSNSKDKTVSQNILKYPILVQNKKNNKLITTFNELANGDLYKFFRIYSKNTELLLNALIQQLFSIIFFNYYTGRVHMDTHPGNFLYHKIKPGGYFHYNIFGKNYYLENLGYLWVIWDFDLSLKVKNALNVYKREPEAMNDFTKLIEFYISIDKLENGRNNLPDIDENDELQKYVIELYLLFLHKYKYQLYNLKNIKDYYLNISKIIINKSSLQFGEKIINKNPYKIKKDDFLK